MQQVGPRDQQRREVVVGLRAQPADEIDRTVLIRSTLVAYGRAGAASRLTCGRVASW